MTVVYVSPFDVEAYPSVDPASAVQRPTSMDAGSSESGHAKYRYPVPAA